MMMIMQQMTKMERQWNEEGADGDLARGGKAFRKVHQMRKRVDRAPIQVVDLYLEEVRRKLGAEPGDPWQPWHYTERIQWGRMLGLKRVHYHLSKILGRILAGQVDQSAAHVVQLLRAVHQTVLDGGSWETSGLLMPDEDPVRRVGWGATERELEAISGYRDALSKLTKGRRNDEEDPPTGAGKDKNKKGAGKGKDKDNPETF